MALALGSEHGHVGIAGCVHGCRSRPRGIGLSAGMEENARQYPDKVLEVKHAVAEGDLVITHSHVRLKPGDLGVVVVHVFRFENDRIAELWDIGQAVPGESANQYGMF